MDARSGADEALRPCSFDARALSRRRYYGLGVDFARCNLDALMRADFIDASTAAVELRLVSHNTLSSGGLFALTSVRFRLASHDQGGFVWKEQRTDVFPLRDFYAMGIRGDAARLAMELVLVGMYGWLAYNEARAIVDEGVAGHFADAWNWVDALNIGALGSPL